MLIDLMDAFITPADVRAADILIASLPPFAMPATYDEYRELRYAILWAVYADEIEALL